MLESARNNLKIAAVHDSVRRPIPFVYRAKTVHLYLLGLISEIDDKGRYIIMTRHELLTSQFCQNNFELCEKQQQQKQTNKQKTPLSDADVPEEENGG